MRLQPERRFPAVLLTLGVAAVTGLAGYVARGGSIPGALRGLVAVVRPGGRSPELPEATPAREGRPAPDGPGADAVSIAGRAVARRMARLEELESEETDAGRAVVRARREFEGAAGGAGAAGPVAMKSAEQVARQEAALGDCEARLARARAELRAAQARVVALGHGLTIDPEGGDEPGPAMQEEEDRRDAGRVADEARSRDDMVRQVAAARAEAKEKSAALAASQAREALLRGQVARAQGDAAAARAELGQYAGRVKAAWEERETATRKEAADLLRQADALRAERDAMRAERDGLRAERDALAGAGVALRAERDGLRRERDALVGVGVALRAERDAAARRAQAAEADSAAARERARAAEADVAAAARSGAYGSYSPSPAQGDGGGYEVSQVVPAAPPFAPLAARGGDFEPAPVLDPDVRFSYPVDPPAGRIVITPRAQGGPGGRAYGGAGRGGYAPGGYGPVRAGGGSAGQTARGGPAGGRAGASRSGASRYHR